MDASPIPAKNEIGVENDEIVDANLRNFIITQYLLALVFQFALHLKSTELGHP
jgi:hypothetical protein